MTRHVHTASPSHGGISLALASALALALALALLASACADRSDRAQPRPPPAVRPDPVTPRAPGMDAIEYTLSFEAAHAHYVEVQAIFPTGERPTIELMMAVWTPGSYLVREYSRHVEGLGAQTLAGSALRVDKHAKNRWRVHTGGARKVAVRYRVYAHEMTVRTNFVDTELALLNGAPTFVTLVRGKHRAHDVQLALPEHYKRVITALPPHPGGTPNRYLAPSYDVLVDSPILIGDPDVQRFDVQGVPHTLANFGGTDAWNSEKTAADLALLVAQQARFWGVIPYDRYVFFNVLGAGGGGLEHKTSTLMMTGRWMSRTHKDYLRWLGLASHEFFHTWNVKRLRPIELGPFDYEREVHTTGLWIAEGISSYYDDLLLARAGLMKESELLERLSAGIKTIETTPGAKVQSLARGSFDAWIKHYRPDENSPNTAISYYTKGSVVAFLLDARIRSVTAGRASLDHVMRAAYKQYSGAKGYTSAEFRAVASRVAGTDLSAFFKTVIDTAAPLDYAPALDYYGLRFAAAEKPKDGEEPAGWLGASVREQGGTIVVRGVRRGTPAYTAGINAGDELIAIDGYRIPAAGLDRRLSRYRPADNVTFLVARRGRLLKLPVTLGKKPAASFKLERVARPTRIQTVRLAGWIAP